LNQFVTICDRYFSTGSPFPVAEDLWPEKQWPIPEGYPKPGMRVNHFGPESGRFTRFYCFY
jgi:hypothetical protein